MTLASLLKDNGYHTAMVGKWHLGMQFPGDPGTRDCTKPVEDMPLDKGFDYYYGRIMPPYDKDPEVTRTKLKRGGFEIAPDFIDYPQVTDTAPFYFRTNTSENGLS